MSNRIHWNGGDLAGCGLVIGVVLLFVIGSIAKEVDFASIFLIALGGAICWFFCWLVWRIIRGCIDFDNRRAVRRASEAAIKAARQANEATIRAAEKAIEEHEQRRLAGIRVENEEQESLRAKAAEELDGLRATMQITADGKIPGWHIARRIRLITTDNYEAKDNPELVFLRHVKAAGGNGVINLQFHDRQGRFISIRGEAVEVIKGQTRKGTEG